MHVIQPLLTGLLVLLLLSASPAQADGEPEILRFWLVDADSDTRIQELENYQSLALPVLPNELSIEVEANGVTESVMMKIEGVISSTESSLPYALGGDNSGDFITVPELQTPGWVDISARPFSANNAAGVGGKEVTFALYFHQPDFFVTDPADRSDGNPGDGICSTRKSLKILPAPSGYQKLAERGYAIERLNPDARAFARKFEPPILRAYPGIIDHFSIFRGCTLRAAIEESNALPGNQSILVDGTKGPFLLTKGQLMIMDGVTIDGHELPLIDAQKDSRVFLIDGQGDDILVNLRSLDIARGIPGATERGGGISIDNDAFVQISDSLIRESRANYGGGIYIQNGGDLRMWRSAVRDNVAGNPESFGGGGITQRGGGIFNLEGTVYITDSSIFNNLAVRGGGISNSGGTMRIENSSVIDNQALSIGGGIQNRHNGDKKGNLHLSFATVANNQAGTSSADPPDQRIGGGLYNTGWAYMASSILAKNTDFWNAGDEHHSPDCYSPTVHDFKSFRNNVVGVLNEYCSLTDYSWGNDAWIDHGSEASPLNPGLTPPSAWGLLGLAYNNLTTSSVALDGGASQSASLYPCTDHDMRSQPRPVNFGCDIGAVERQ